MIIEYCEQSSPEWFDLIKGNPGASSMHKIITSTGKPSTQAEKYLNQLFDEIILNRNLDSYSNWRMDEGIELEQESRNHYQFMHDVEIEQVGLIWKDEKKLFHCSPDGIIQNKKQGFETKDALPHIQRERLKNGKPDTLHWIQCQMSLYVTEYDSWIYQSYCRNMEPLTVEIFPDFEFIKKMEAELYRFVGKLQAIVKQYKKEVV